MTPFTRGTSGKLSIYIPRATGVAIERATGTADRKLVKSYEHAVHWLATQTPPAWDVLEALTAKRITWAQLLETHAAGRAALAPLRAKLADVDLRPLVPTFRDAWIADGKVPRTLDNYVREITAYLTAHPMRSDWTAAHVQAHLRGLTITSGSRRKHLYALRAFERWLVETNRLPATVLHTIRTPKKNPPRLRYESAAVDEKVTAAVAPRYRAACALIHATGADVSSVLAMRGRDLDIAALRCHIPGTKTAHRYRHDIPIEPWAVPFLTELRTTMPDALLFPAVTRHKLAWAHKQAGEAVHVTGYTLRDARHTIAVTMRRRGDPFEAIAARLGNSVWQVVSVYSAFTPEDTAATLKATELATGAVVGAITPHARKA
jgi:integrase